jgi:hypothetical protein
MDLDDSILSNYLFEFEKILTGDYEKLFMEPT